MEKNLNRERRYRYQTKTQVLGDGNACLQIRIRTEVMLDPDPNGETKYKGILNTIRYRIQNAEEKSELTMMCIRQIIARTVAAAVRAEKGNNYSTKRILMTKQCLRTY
jgi:hypothetical protein